MIEKALEFVTAAFQGKTDKGGSPYLEHLLRVQEKVKKYGKPEVETVALLHDLLEDCPEWDVEKLKGYFSNNVVAAVVCQTR